jgi:tetratricopeptide (TPR) repeat protein
MAASLLSETRAPRRRAAFGGALLLASLPLLAAACRRDSSPSAPGPVEEAETLAARGQEVEAARLLQAGLRSLPASRRPAARLTLAGLYHRAGLFTRSLEEAEESLRSAGESPEALYLKGDSLRQLQRLGEAESALARALELEPGHRPAELALASLRFRSSDPSSALPLFESYFKTAPPGEPELEEPLLEYGRALRAAGRFQEAADRFMILLERDPLEAPLYSELASSLYRLRLREEARFVEQIYRVISQSSFEEHVEKGLEKSGAAALALGQRAANRIRERRYLAAFQSYRRAVEIDSSSPLLRIYSAELSLRFRRLREARALLEASIALDLRPVSGLHFALARLLLESGEFPAALAAARRGVETLQAEGDQGGVERGQAPAFPLELALAAAALGSGDLPAAEGAVVEAESRSPEAWETRYWRGRIALERGRAGEASARFEEARRLGGGSFPDLSDWAAEALAKAGRSGPAPEAAARGRLEPRVEEKRRLEKTFDERPLEECGETYLALGKLRLELKDPGGFDDLFLASELLPRKAEPLHLLLSGMKAPQDLFVRIQLQRRLLDLEPGSPSPPAELARHYLKLHVRLEEASRLAERLEEIAPSALSSRIRAEAARLRGDPRGAREILRKGVQTYPGDAALREELARIGEPETAPEKAALRP